MTQTINLQSLVLVAANEKAKKADRREAVAKIEAYVVSKGMTLDKVSPELVALKDKLARERKQGVVARIHALILDPKVYSWAEILKIVKAEFPDCKTTTKSISSEAKKLRQDLGEAAVPHRTIRATPKLDAAVFATLGALQDLDDESDEDMDDESDEDMDDESETEDESDED